MDIAEILLTWC